MTLFESAPYEHTFPTGANETTRDSVKPSHREREKGHKRASTNLDMYKTDISTI